MESLINGLFAKGRNPGNLKTHKKTARIKHYKLLERFIHDNWDVIEFKLRLKEAEKEYFGLRNFSPSYSNISFLRQPDNGKRSYKEENLPSFSWIW